MELISLVKFGMIVNPTAGPTNVGASGDARGGQEGIGRMRDSRLGPPGREEFIQCAVELAREWRS
jgi:hypothetical protein